VTEKRTDEKKDRYKVKTFRVPFSLKEVNEAFFYKSYPPSRTSNKQIVNKAFKFHSQGNLSEAAKCYQNLIRHGYKDYRVFSNYGSILKKLGKLQDAEIFQKKAIELKPDFAEAYSNLGNILKDLGKLHEAKSYQMKAIELKPDLAEAYSNLGNILKDLGKLHEAEKSLRKAIEIKPYLTNSHYNLGIILFDLYKLKEAESFQRKAIELNPNFAEAHCSLGNILKDLGKLQEAEKSLLKAIELKPNFAIAHCTLGSILRDLGKLNQAESSHLKAIEIDPDLAEAHLNLSMVLLTKKRFKEGWNQYEWRWKVKNKNKMLKTSKPEWEQGNNGKVLIWAEQGIGDEILFASLIPEFTKNINQLILKVDKRLIPLFKRSFDKKIIYVNKESHINELDYDYHIAIGSLPKFLRNSKESFKKGKTSYLKSDTRKTNLFRHKLTNQKYKKVVGISWKSDSKINKHKSISIEEFILGIYSNDVCFVSLQYGDTKEEIKSIKEKYGINIFEITEVNNFNDIDGLAAVINACDLVVSIENMIFSLAGSLGVKSKILLTKNCLFYNRVNNLESYWFPSQEFFKQGSSNEWGEALRQIKKTIDNCN